MVLATDLKGPDGRLLFKSGTPLSSRHATLLARVGVEEVDVREDTALTAEQLREIEDYVRDFFLYANPDFEPTIAMFHIALDQVAEAVAEGWVLPDLSRRRAVSVEHLEDIFLTGMGTPETIVKHESELASFPDIYFRIREVLADERASADAIARVVGTDVSLAAKLLKLVNSPFYGFPQEIDSVSRAVALVGHRELSTLALGISAINYFRDIPPELVDMRGFWRHSITCGVIAKILAETQTGLSSERFFTAGLLHDVGRLILFKKLPYASTEAMLFARENAIPLVEAEREIMGFCHTDISKPLLASWKFPETLSNMVNHHHDPMTFPNPLGPSVIHVADTLTNVVELAQGGMYAVPPLDEAAWEQLGLDPSILRGVAESCRKQIEAIMEAFF
ncbi:HDOD domain-containing protein [Pseudodesulfovibrio sp.]|uniref:HDOD domain-containing protein n=1 Tax=Pseudodesulfovibrio sp. TaxID=2035812 RepID=UPI00261CD7CF|nr:HDOD domain-containing protein [Pseudodesulfovibrio sp.]MDD3310562.1 HDOD domain-containing protein [Pseudodesulfovibrio sp.]